MKNEVVETAADGGASRDCERSKANPQIKEQDRAHLYNFYVGRYVSVTAFKDKVRLF